MPALAVSIPTYPRFDNLKDADSPVDRQLESIMASLSLAQGALRGISIDPATGVVWSTAALYPRPTHVTVGGATTYKNAIDAALAACTTAFKQVYVAGFTTTTS